MKDKNPIPQEESYDATKARQDRCAPVVKLILEQILDKNLLVNDLTYVEQMVNAHLQLLLKSIVFDHFNEIFSAASDTVRHALDTAIEIKLGKARDELTIADIENILKTK